MAIGDNLNDVSMLERARYSFAMSNGAEEVKRLLDIWPGIMKKVV